jgi:hypothetical protein
MATTAPILRMADLYMRPRGGKSVMTQPTLPGRCRWSKLPYPGGLIRGIEVVAQSFLVGLSQRIYRRFVSAQRNCMPSRCSQSSSGLFSNATTSAPTSRSQILWTLAFMVGQLGAIDEYEVAAIDSDRPAAARVDNVWAADVDTIAHVVAEIVDNDSPASSLVPG